jgi:hypothetical protein
MIPTTMAAASFHGGEPKLCAKEPEKKPPEIT